MPLINTASKVYRGGTLATKVYRGTVLVWPPAPAFGATQSIYTTQTGTGSSAPGPLALANDVTFAAAGRVIGMRFWRSATATLPTRTLRLWSSGGVLLGTCTTSGDSGSGWKSALFTTPIAVTAGQVCRMVVEAPSGEQMAGIGLGVTVNGDLTMSANSYYGASNAYPASVAGSDYMVDVLYQKKL